MHDTALTTNSELSNEAYQHVLTMLQATEAGRHNLTTESFKVLIEDLTSYGNKVGNNQRLALYELLAEMTAFALGIACGRKAFSLPTGCGKTSAIIAWVSIVYSLGLDDIALSVSAFTVSALCDIKIALIEHGVPESEIGIKYANAASLPYPSTGNQDRRIQLVTHARVSGGVDDDLFIKHRGISRALMIYDESLIKASSGSIAKKNLSADVAWLSEIVKGTKLEPDYLQLLMYLKSACEQIEAALEVIKLNPSEVVMVELPVLNAKDCHLYLKLVGKYPRCSHILELVENTDMQLRVGTSNQGAGVVWYEICIPQELSNILILDASYPIRRLIHLDTSIIQGSKLGNLPIKRFDNIVFHEMKARSGRNAMQENFISHRKEDRNISREIVEVVRNAGADKSILVVTFKKKYGEVDIQKVLTQDLKEAGVNTEQTTTSGATRINFLTWGNETSLNTFSHCEVVIIAGVLQLPSLSLASKIIGQKDDIRASADNSSISEVNDGEQAHCVYQALSRGSCRVVEYGQAKAMQVYLINNNTKVSLLLKEVMQGATWLKWSELYNVEENMTKQALIAKKIKTFLDALPVVWDKVSTKELKRLVFESIADSASTKLFNRGLNIVLNEYFNGWTKQGHALIRHSTILEY